MKFLSDKIFNKRNYERINKAINCISKLDEFQKYLDNYLYYLLEVNTVFINYGYPPIDNIEILEISQYIEEYIKGKNIDEEDFNYLITIYFDEEHLKRLEKEVNNYSLPQDDIDILKETLEGYKKGYYNLIIPTLLARLEGLVYQSVGFKGEAKYSKFDTIISEGIDKYKSNHNFDFKNQDYEDVKKFYKNEIKKSFKFGENIVDEINRHAIMHGYNNKYGTKLNAIKLFLHYEYLYHCLSKLEDMDKQKILKRIKRK